MGEPKDMGRGRCAWTPRGCEPGCRRARAGARRGARPSQQSLKSTLSASRAAVPEAVQSWQPRAGSLGSVTSSLGVPGTFTSACGVFGCFSSASEGRRALLFAFLSAQERTRAREGGCGEGRGDRPGAAVGLCPGPAVLPSDGFGKAKNKHPVSLARPHAFLFFLSYKS